MTEKNQQLGPKINPICYNCSVVSSKKDIEIFNNLIWMTTRETAFYLRKSVNSIHTLVSRGSLRARKFKNRLYFKKVELDFLLETSEFKGG